ncbi:phosphofructokinase [Isosphaera pallida ATCC 43644]|uniref:6-phosphofructokinase n=1 Tax=Isosphaera pallida (strain ATCC 43644 / DSM 9630 / IS1B) TaxID=575540 RepID=E8QZ23_ISOPI|nr:6-phosphofructokinase [Isosphaera pallida]ADV63165.1 phosphofructokinase [Isosphaera pallida ATCC 43644]
MNRIGILTAGGDTPALNATIYGAVIRANQLRVEVFGFIKGFNGLLNPEAPHVHLNPLLIPIPELDPARGGTILGASRDYVGSDDREIVLQAVSRLKRLQIDGLICVGGDGTLNGMMNLADHIPVVLAPKTIDNDLGLNYPDEVNEWVRSDENDPKSCRKEPGRPFRLEEMINYVTPGYASAVYVTSRSVQRIRTTAESHRRIAIIEVMGRDSGMIALGTAYGQPDLIMVPEVPIDPEILAEKVIRLIEIQKHALMVVSEGVRDASGRFLGDVTAGTDPAGNLIYRGAAETVKNMLVDQLSDHYFIGKRRHESAEAAIFVRKVGHDQRGGRPIRFDRLQAALLGAKAVELLLERRYSEIATLSYRDGGLEVESVESHKLRDRYGVIHYRPMAPSFYDAERMQPSAQGVEYLRTIFTNSVSHGDIEAILPMFSTGNLVQPYHSVNVDVHKRIRRLKP